MEAAEEEVRLDKDMETGVGVDFLGIEGWLRLFDGEFPEDVFEDNAQNVTRATRTVVEDPDNDDDELKAEECCEEAWEEPPPLPEGNDPVYPSENKAFFDAQQEPGYVRNGRIPLKMIHDIAKRMEQSGLEFPSMRTLYEKDQGVTLDGW